MLINFLPVAQNTYFIVAFWELGRQGIPNEVVHGGFCFSVACLVIQLQNFRFYLG